MHSAMTKACPFTAVLGSYLMSNSVSRTFEESTCLVHFFQDQGLVCQDDYGMGMEVRP